MLLEIHTIRDAKGGIYHPPMFSLRTGEATATFAEIINNPQTSIHKYPEDFDLFYLGTYENNTGKMTLEPTPVHVMKAIDLVKKTQPETEPVA